MKRTGWESSQENEKILYIYVSDPDGATVGGIARAAADKLTYIYIGGAMSRASARGYRWSVAPRRILHALL